MTHYDDPLKQGRAYYARAISWSPNNQYGPQYTNIPANQTEARGIPHTQTITYEVGAASTPLASGIVFTTASQGGSLTATGALVTSGVATLDVARAIQVTASTNLATVLVTIRGTDGYGQALTCTFIGPSGNTLGNNGSFVFSPSAFKTVTTASIVGLASAGLQVGSAPVIGLPFRIANAGKVMTINVNGIYSATAGFSTTAAGGTVGPVFPGFAASGTHTASGADVRGMIGLPTTNLPDGTKLITFSFIAPTVGVTEAADTKENSYGLTPFSS